MKLRFLLSLLVFGILGTLHSQLYINEVSQGIGNKEYVELIVVGTPTCTDTSANLQGWILDDNCGFFGTVGIAGGNIRFKANEPQWASIKYGTIILIYRGDDIFPGIVPDENDSNNDNVYVLPSSSNLFEKNVSVPVSNSVIASYGTTGYTTGGGTWVMLGMKNSSDVFQTISPTDLTTAYHSVGWGSSIAGTDIYFAGSASGLTFVNQNLVDDDPRNQANWVPKNSTTQATAGTMNSPPNGIWINALHTASASGGNTLKIIDTTICNGETMFLQGALQNATGVFFDTISVVTGCDTVVKTNLTVLAAAIESVVNLTDCKPILYNGITYTNSIVFFADSVSNSNACLISYNRINITISSAATNVNLGDTSVCFGQSVVIFGVSETESKIYIDTIKGALGCDSLINSFELIANALPNISAGENETIAKGNEVILEAEGGDTYIWSTNGTSQAITVSPSETTTYFVTGTDANNCENTDSVIVNIVIDEVEIKIPTAFSPNGNGINDTFRIVNEELFENIHLRVYNRWGELVFNSDKNISGWDGVYKNTKQPLDSYIYYIEAVEKTTKKSISVSGSVALLR